MLSLPSIYLMDRKQAQVGDVDQHGIVEIGWPMEIAR